MGRRWPTAALAWLLAMGGLVAPAGAAGAPAAAAPSEPPDWAAPLAEEPPPAPEPLPDREPTPVARVGNDSSPPAEVEFPEPATWDVVLGEAGETAAPADGSAAPAAGAAGDLPVRVAPGVGDAEGEPLRVEVFDRDVAARVGASGFVFELSEPASGEGRGARPGVLSQAAEDGGLPAEVTVDYSGFAEAYGADHARRLQVVRLPRCALEDPVPVACDLAGERLPSRNDLEGERLVVELDDLAEAATTPPASEVPTDEAAAIVDAVGTGTGTRRPTSAGAAAPSALLAVTSGLRSDAGSFAASPMSMTGSWQVSPGSGEFGWSYPIAAPAPGAGSAPAVSLDYSSGAIDGMTAATNTQANQAGLGWSDFANAYIERSYQPCAAGGDFTNIADLCWKPDNATISLAGISGPLLPVDEAHGEWRAKSDPGWEIERLTGAMYTDIHEDQYWKVTGPDGTIYYFGVGHMPGRQTNSVLGVTVYANNPGEPCRSPTDQFDGCTQGWRWYLDRIVDPDGNVTSLLYERETNWYAALRGIAGQNAPYHRAARLTEIVYGGRDWDESTYSARVLFDSDERCSTPDDGCPAATHGNGSEFPDVPNDAICAGSTTAGCPHSPSFFSTYRYTAVRTEVKDGGVWRPVAADRLYHGFHPAESVGPKKMLLMRVQHEGRLNFHRESPAPAPLLSPAVELNYTLLPNRADVADQASLGALLHFRLTTIETHKDQTPGTVVVGYTQNRPCTPSYSPSWDQNTRDCFPQNVVDDGYTHTGVWHKYLVGTVTEKPGVGSPDMVTSYGYVGDPAWTFDSGSFARFDHLQGWSQWRGYGETEISQGAASHRAVRTFRGRDGDATIGFDSGGNPVVLFGEREASLTASDGSVQVDDPALAGRTLEEQLVGPISGGTRPLAEATIYEYGIETTATSDDTDVPRIDDPEWAGVTRVTDRVADPGGGMRTKQSTMTYNANNQVATTTEHGWLDVTGDERCTRTTYADSTAAGMFAYPSSNTLLAGDCTTGTVLSTSETYYDDHTGLSDPPTRGNPTRQRTLVDSGSGTWSETLTEFDDLGRPTKVTDPNGGETTTLYEFASVGGLPQETQVPALTTVTNPEGHQTITEPVPETGAPRTETNANGKLTGYTYDRLGRVTEVWLPTEPRAFAEPSWRFEYDMTNRVVRSRRLVSESRCCGTEVFEDSWTVHDGLGRERQLQARSPEAGKVLMSEATYDERGLLRDETVEQAFTGTPGTYVTPGGTWANRTRHLYDGLGRETAQQWWRDSTVAWSTTTEYGADTVTTTGPTGPEPDQRQVRSKVDGLGRTVEVAEHDGTGWVSSTYGYDLADRLVKVTDPDGNHIDYGYNQAGWRTFQLDPNRGGALFGYDAAGNQVVAAHASGDQVNTSYDGIGRPLQRRSGGPTGTLLVSWEYDAAGGIGLPSRTTRHTTGGDWISEVTGYDDRNRPLGGRLTVPAGVPGLGGATYTATQTYDRADRAETTTYPAIGGLPEETVTTTWSDLGLATSMTSSLAGAAPYVRQVGYDDRGRRTTAAYGPDQLTSGWMIEHWAYDQDQRLQLNETAVADGSSYQDVARHTLSYAPDGNMTDRTTLLGGDEWRECHGYDERSRLVSTYTVDVADTCAAGEPGTGDQPFEHSYAYTPGGDLDERVEDGVSTTYTYPAPGSVRPHAPTEVGDDDYTWDVRGNLASRTVGGAAETLAWNAEGHLASVTGPAGTTSFVYDPDGGRLLRRTPSGDTLYFAGHEITTNTAGTVTSAVRSYSFEGELVATRSLGGVDHVISDDAASVEMTVPSGGVPGAPGTASRAYEPYGAARAEAGDADTDRGFVGQVEDGTTNLSYLNARYYDTTIGLFVSTDPLYDTAKPKTLNPYAYAAGNPMLFTDASGLSPSYRAGLEYQIGVLQLTNADLLAKIKGLFGDIETLQNIIKDQNRDINALLTENAALHAIVRQQAEEITRLRSEVRRLNTIVIAQRREISRLKYKIKQQNAVIKAQARTIHYQRNVIRGLVDFTFGRSKHNPEGLPIWIVGVGAVDRTAALGLIEGGQGHRLTAQMHRTRLDGLDGLAVAQATAVGQSPEMSIGLLEARVDFYKGWVERLQADAATDGWDQACQANSAAALPLLLAPDLTFSKVLAGASAIGTTACLATGKG